MGSFSTLNPATGVVLKSYDYVSPVEAEHAVLAAQSDFNVWRKISLNEKEKVLLSLAQKLRAEKEDLAQSMHNEMGKTIAESFAEIEKCAVTCEFYAGEAASMLKNEKVSSSPYASAEVSFQPLGVIFCIMPWNFPLWQVIRFAAPALMAGNVLLLKHSDITAGTAQKIGQLFDNLFPPLKLLRNVHVNHSGAAQLIAHPLIRGVTFTGSSRGGSLVAQEAAKNLKKIVLELGGSDAYLILEDADIPRAAKTCAQTRLINCGQSCVAGKRFVVLESVAAEFVKCLVAEMGAIELAPLAHEKFKHQVASQVEKLKSWGGEVVLGGTASRGPDAFYPATVVVFKENHLALHQEEIFGPVASVVIVKNVEEAIEVANSSPFGLGGGVFTSNLDLGKKLVETELQAGFVVVNDFVKSDPRLPFGGIKDSGYGRELGRFGMMEFVNIKTVAVAGV